MLTFPKTKCALIRKIVVKYSRKDRVEVPDLLRNLARNLIGSYRVFIRLLAKAKIKASKHEGERDSKPKAEQCHHCGEWNLAWGEGKREALSLVPRPFPPPVFDRILYAKTDGEGLGERVTCVTSGRREGRH